jgi:Mg-chelatase subunit ChlD
MKKKTEIIVVLDRSGSMDAIKAEAIEGFNTFLEHQKAIKGEAHLSMIQFDHEYEVICINKKISKASYLSATTYQPRGTTALLDAIGKTIHETKDRISNKKNPAEKAKVVFVIITDGHENSSTLYNRSQIFKLIRDFEKKENWQFVFIGANQDAIEEASHLGINANRSMTFVADKEGTKNMFFDMSINIQEMRCEDKNFEFKDSQRAKQKR